MAKRSATINLVKTDKNQLGNQIINWALTIGRVLIIIVELIALSAFLYRFVLDNQLRDINSKIKQDQAILSEQKEKEDNYRNLQDRLILEESFINQGRDQVKIIKDVIELAPQGLTFKSISLSTKNINIQLNVNSVFPLSVFINSLKSYKLTDYVSIDKIDNRTTSSVITVGLSVYLKDQGGANANTGN